jgi:tRNA-Thr(GGU) m(6)t(6)A37 methyltransferase TsaA
MTNYKKITLRPIGLVKNGIAETPRHADWQLETLSELVIEPEWGEGLQGIEEFSHIIVLFWIDRIKGGEIPLKVHPMHREDLPLTGLFSTRTPNRPNRIGLTVVRLLEHRGNVLKVTGLDALDGSPVLDIKPYLRSGELIPEAKEPPWTREAHGQCGD